ncbi:Flavin-dependent monooxygenase, reductase subunit HsaB [Corynebacterium occultum]|uniref:Flavin-dependent monooxygenase, reductase subunit HsaB n=1 Tax=Corynebacterium occultum TaxID=2675219 RepID=A0A6B8W9I2_9CORY|nr:flavin reductase family protein [Corynebacterium occultum]QGU08627.1 Flavin-dependent monooxygenase, reductase subunit HsaB [Corynebacterium occultum]
MSVSIPDTFDPKIFREVMGHYPTGVAVVTGRSPEGEILALVVGTFASVSLDPPLVSFMPMKTSRTFQKLRTCSSLCINIFGGEQQAEMLAIAQRWENKLDGIEWYPSPSGDPVLRNSIAWVDTTIADVVEAGDHWIVLCAVSDLQVTNSVPPLLFFQGGYGSFAGLESGSRMSHEILPAIHAAHNASDQLRDLAHSIGCEVSVFAAVSDDEMATVFSELSADATREGGLASRFPLVPPIGDSYFFDKSPELQQRWMNKLKNPSEELQERHRRRLEFMREQGYLLAFLPEEGSAAYEQMIRATQEYKKISLTPIEERSIRETIGSTPVNYEPREVVDNETYDIGSIVFPVKDPSGQYTMTLRLAQLPGGVPGAKIREWVSRSKAVIQDIERAERNH